jgi:hypothetical protein
MAAGPPNLKCFKKIFPYFFKKNSILLFENFP